MLTQIYPEYLEKFKCIGSDRCSTSCCKKAFFSVDADSLAAIQFAVKDSRLATYVQLAFYPPQGHKGEARLFLSRMNPNTTACWLLEEGQCALQQQHGEALMPKRCADYPRIKLASENVRETYLSPSCPEVGKLFWAMPNLFDIFEHQGYSDQSVVTNSTAFSVCSDKVRQFVVQILRTTELSLVNRIQIIIFFAQVAGTAYENADVVELQSMIDGITNLIVSGDESIRFENVERNDSLHAMLIFRLLSLRHEKNNEGGWYREATQEMVTAFGLSRLEQSIEEKVLAAVPYIRDAFDDFAKRSTLSPVLLDNILINYWLMYRFPSALPDQSLAVNIAAFVLHFLLVRAALAAAAATHPNFAADEAAFALAVTYREWVDDSPVLFAFAQSILDAELGGLNGLLTVV